MGPGLKVDVAELASARPRRRQPPKMQRAEASAPAHFLAYGKDRSRLPWQKRSCYCDVVTAPHPFFETMVFPWEREDAEQFHRALYRTFRTSAAIDGVYRGSGENLKPLNLGQGPDPLWHEALDALVTARRLSNLCDRLLGDAALVAIHPQIQAVIDAKSAIGITLFSPGCVFVDRRPLKEKLAKLSAASAAPTVLLVRGASRSGNTWTEKLVGAVAASYGGVPVYIYDGFVASVKDVVLSLFTAIGQSGYELPADSTDPAVYMQICRDLWGAAQKSGKVYWIIADDLGPLERPRLDPEIRSFFDQFVLMMASSAMSKWFRLVLLNYPAGQVPTRWRDEVWLEDKPDIAEVDAGAIAEFVQSSALELGKQMSAEEAQRVAAEVFQAAAAADQADRLKAINAELKRRVEQL
jgi:hypothetical protein